MAENPALTLVLPAYNEARRLPAYLSEIRTYMVEQFGNANDAYEVIVVDDGSADDLASALAGGVADWSQMRLLHHDRNQGKGAAVRTGVLAARGAKILFADADGATPIAEELKLRRAIDDGADVAIASRLIPDTQVTRQRTIGRQFVGYVFAKVARLSLRLPVQDTQCGFKMFRHRTARRVFSAVTETGYLFDLELLALAHRHGDRIVEVPVNWHDVAGSKLRLSREWWSLATGLWRLKRRWNGDASVPAHNDQDS